MKSDDVYSLNGQHLSFDSENEGEYDEDIVVRFEENHNEADYDEEDSENNEEDDENTDYSYLDNEDTKSGVPSAFSLYLGDVAKYPPFTPEEEKECWRQINNGNAQAKEDMFYHNMRLVIKIAKGYYSTRLDILDLISCGNLGLLRAIEKFDVSRGYKFSTYATGWIKSFIQKSLAVQDHPINIPVHVGEALIKIKKINAKFETKYGRLPNDDELITETGYKPEFIRDLASLREQEVSLDAKINTQQGERTFADVIPMNDTAFNMMEYVDENEYLCNRIEDMLISMEPARREVFMKLFGVRMEKVYEPRELAEEYGIKLKEIKNIRKEGLDILSVDDLRDKIYDYLFTKESYLAQDKVVNFPGNIQI